MRKLLRLTLGFFFTLLITTTGFAIVPVEPSLAPMLQNVMPAVVNIRAQIKVTDFNTLREIQKQQRGNQNDSSDQAVPNTFVSVGSGVIVDAKKWLYFN